MERDWADARIAELEAELASALDHQAAMRGILEVISRSSGSADPVFEAILTNACELCVAEYGHLLLCDGETWRAAALQNVPKAYEDWWNRAPVVASPDSLIGRLYHTAIPQQIEDVQQGPAYRARTDLGVATAELGEARTLMGVPLVKDGKVLGGIVVYRKEVRPFSDRQIELLASFADQAVIAIENARLFEAEQDRSGELQEALEYQTATAEVLGIISRAPNTLQPVLEAITERAARLCAATDAVALLRAEDWLEHRAHFGPIPLEFTGLALTRDTVSARCVIERRTIHVRDIQAERETFSEGYGIATRVGYHTVLGVPLIRDSEAIGALVLRRMEIRHSRKSRLPSSRRSPTRPLSRSRTHICSRPSRRAPPNCRSRSNIRRRHVTY